MDFLGDVFNKASDLGLSYLKPDEAEANDKTPPAATPSPAPTEKTSFLPWIIGGVVVLGLVIVGFVFMGRKTA